MSPKRKAIVLTSGLLVVALVCARVAWSASEVGGLLGLCLAILAAVFVLASIAAAVSCIGLARSPSEAFAKPAVSGRRNGSNSPRELPAEFEMPFAEAASKKQPRPAKKPSSADVSAPIMPPSNGKKPRPAPRPAPEASAE